MGSDKSSRALTRAAWARPTTAQADGTSGRTKEAAGGVRQRKKNGAVASQDTSKSVLIDDQGTGVKSGTHDYF